jgi:benzoate-CoA ligase
VSAPTESSSTWDLEASPPTPRFSSPYNAAADLIGRNLAAGRGDKVAFLDDRGATTYAELSARVDRAGAALLALGIEPEQRVLLCLLDSVDFVALFLGAIKVGIIPVPVNTLLPAADYTFLLRDSRARALFVSDALVEKLRDAVAAAPLLRKVVVVDTTLGGPDDGHAHLGELLAAALPTVVAAETAADDVAFWLYSSGSTGAPKGTLHGHASLITTAYLYAHNVLGIREDDVVYSAAKLFFAYGLGNSLTFPLSVGATTILCAERPTPATVLRVLGERGPTIFCGVPTLFASLLATATAGQTAPALRVCTSAGEALPEHVGSRWRARFGVDILDGIGSTEMLHIFISNRPGEIRYGTTGRAVPGYALELRDDSGNLCPDGVEGALWVSGPSAAHGYYNQRTRTLGTFHGPWTRTGDRYTRDREGYYTYAGRADDMLKVGGIWVSPFEVESALSAHDSVLEVAVVGQADRDGLIKPKAYVRLRRAEDACDALADTLKAFVKTRLATYKYPRWVEFVGELPKTATGKIQRFKLREP